MSQRVIDCISLLAIGACIGIIFLGVSIVKGGGNYYNKGLEVQQSYKNEIKQLKEKDKEISKEIEILNKNKENLNKIIEIITDLENSVKKTVTHK